MKRFLSVAIVAMMVLCLALPAMADEVYTAKLSDVTGLPGETYMVTLTLEQEVADVGSGRLDVYVEGLTLTGGEWLIGAELEDFDCEEKRGVFGFEGSKTLSGALLTLTFTAPENTDVTYDVSATMGFKDSEGADIAVEIVNGSVRVEACEHEAGSEWEYDEETHRALCAHCGRPMESEPHAGTVLVGVVAPCESDGYTGDLYCVCGYKVSEGEVIPMTGHQYEDGVCIHCGAEEAPATGDALALTVALAVLSGGALVVLAKKKHG